MFIKYPSTPHIMENQILRTEKILTSREVKEVLGNDVFIEEKIDGANLGISFDENGDCCLQNRGHYLNAPLYGQWGPLQAWIKPRLNALFDVLEDRYILFGEWCYAKHTVYYDELPDWFVAFDVYDKIAGRYLAVYRRNSLIDIMGLARVPQIYHGRVFLHQLPEMIGLSKFGHETAEGLYIRVDDAKHLLLRAKFVRQDFIQKDDAHWSQRQFETNRLGY